MLDCGLVQLPHLSLGGRRREQLDIIPLVSWNSAREENGVVLCVLQDELHHQLHVRQTGGIMGSDLGPSTWAQSVLEQAGPDLAEFPSTDDVDKTESLQTDVMATILELRECSHSIPRSLCLLTLQCQCP